MANLITLSRLILLLVVAWLFYQPPVWWSFAVCLGLATVMAWISWHTVERLGRLGRDRVASQRAPRAGDSPAV